MANEEAKERGTRAAKKKPAARGGLSQVAEAMRLRQARARAERRRGAAAPMEVAVMRPLLPEEYAT